MPGSGGTARTAVFRALLVVLAAVVAVLVLRGLAADDAPGASTTGAPSGAGAVAASPLR